MNEVDHLLQAETAPSAGRNTEKQAKTVQGMLNTAIILKGIQTTLEICAYRFPKASLALMQSSLDAEDAAGILKNPLLLLPSLLSFGIVLLFYFLLSKQNRQTTEACTPLLILTVILPFITSAVSVPLSIFTTRWITQMLNTESIGAYSIIRTTVSLVAFISAPVIPLLAASAGMLFCRRKQTQA